MFGDGSSSDDSGATLFADSAAAFVEWTTPAPAQVNTVRLFARGDASGLELGTFTLRAKSPGSDTFDILVGTFTPMHPYTLLDATTFAILDKQITPVVATAFRAEFDQNSANGARVLELDAFATTPEVTPAIVVNPKSQSSGKKTSVTMCVVARGGALTYQWKLNGKALLGATSPTLTIANIGPKDDGNYTVVVSNHLGSVESAPAVLTVPNGNPRR
jgi:hypothetical protein